MIVQELKEMSIGRLIRLARPTGRSRRKGSLRLLSSG